ncbi:hypothetical protein AVW15_17735 [Chelatococcus daeguensis]|nr:hypothetical protein AVW15_17735 [Chelatococcus daeguensis]
MDIAVIPSGPVPARFHVRTLYAEDFVIAMRAGHPFFMQPTLEHYSKMRHLVVSFTGNPFGFIDEFLANEGISRRIALTVPSFMFALAVLAETDLISALPRRFVAMHAARFGVVARDPPLGLTRFHLRAVAPEVALMDTGVAWLFDILEGTVAAEQNRRRRSPAQRSRS